MASTSHASTTAGAGGMGTDERKQGEHSVVLKRLRAHHAARFGKSDSSRGVVVCDKDTVPSAHDRGHAAVLVGLFADKAGTTHVVLTQRAHTLRRHAGEVALPGGKMDVEDGNLLTTALRECEEEVGMPASVVTPVCVLEPAISKHGLMVLPVVATVPADWKYVLNASEVAAVFACPLETFLHSKGHMHRDIRYGDFPFRIHFFSVEDVWTGNEFTVWGMTAGMLIRVAETAFGAKADFDRQAPGCPGRTAVITSQLRSRHPPPSGTAITKALGAKL